MKPSLIKFSCMGILLIFPCFTRAQDPISIIQEGITIVIKAVDLQVQRIQTQTIWLEEAQKTIENTMSQLDLDDIRGWVQAQKELYEGYFQELWQVKTVISSYQKVSHIIQRQQQIIAGYKQAYALFSRDQHFTPDELSHMTAVYTGILNESAANLDQLLLVVNSFTTQMTDRQRIAIIDKAAENMDRNYSDLCRFNDQNALLSAQRGGELNEILLLKNLYGL